MINFPSITSVNTVYSSNVQTQAQQAQTANLQTSVVDNTRLSENNLLNTSAMKAQIAASDINFNQNFYSSIQYLNAHASLGLHKQVEGKIFVASDVFAMNEKGSNSTVSQLQNRLSNIDNLAKDRNGSQSLLYTRTDSERRQMQGEAAVPQNRLQGLYA